MATQVKNLRLATETKGWMCPAPGAPLVFNVVTLPPLKSTQVQIEMKMCGLCHTDVHMCDNDWVGWVIY
jgi:D-arabinose 1-dehydrogenase-like Zn-dependent alcohol dehydrogenase